MKKASQERIIRARNRMLADFDKLLRELEVSKDQVIQIYRNALREKGGLAELLASFAGKILPPDATGAGMDIPADDIEQKIKWFFSEEYKLYLLDQPEPTTEELDQAIAILRDTLPNLRDHLLGSAKRAPRRRRGGRPKQLANPIEREKIREEIIRLRKPGIRLQVLFERLARKHSVSVTTIKRIWAEKPREKDSET